MKPGDLRGGQVTSRLGLRRSGGPPPQTNRLSLFLAPPISTGVSRIDPGLFVSVLFICTSEYDVVGSFFNFCLLKNTPRWILLSRSASVSVVPGRSALRLSTP